MSREHVPGVCCPHEFVFEKRTPSGRAEVKRCATCRASAVYVQGQIVIYNAPGFENKPLERALL